MLLDLVILNGEMSLKFDPLNTKYTITLNNNANELKIDYKLKEGCEISISGNNLIKNKNELILKVYNDTESVNYYLTVYKENTTNVSTNNLLAQEVEVAPKVVPNYVAPLISSICFIAILLLFTLLFKKRKNTDFNKSAEKPDRY